MSEARWLTGDVFERMAELPDGSVDMIVTSPPFLALRSYLPAGHPDKDKEIGSEPTPAAFLSTLLALTREWRRIVAPHGSICVELGDTYAGSGGAGGDYTNDDGFHAGQPVFRNRNWKISGVLDKSLCGIPAAYELSLIYGWNVLSPAEKCDRWRVRNLLVWHRPNPPVGALGDKVRPSTSYVTVACVSDKRWFDLDAERTAHKADPEKYSGNGYSKGNPEGIPGNESMPGNRAGAPPLDCWTIPTAPFSGAHHATFPPALPRKLINLMCPRQVCTVCGEPRRRMVEPLTPPLGTGFTRTRSAPRTLGWTDCGCFDKRTVYEQTTWRRGIVLDPFAGSGTTLMAASELGRDSIGIDLDDRNLDLARERVGMFLVEAS